MKIPIETMPAVGRAKHLIAKKALNNITCGDLIRMSYHRIDSDKHRRAREQHM